MSVYLLLSFVADHRCLFAAGLTASSLSFFFKVSGVAVPEKRKNFSSRAAALVSRVSRLGRSPLVRVHCHFINFEEN